MKYKISVLIIIAEIIVFSNSLLSSRFCKISQKKCIGSYDLSNKYNINCTDIKCNGKHKYKCGQDTCATSRSECDTYLELTNLINSYSMVFYKYLVFQTASMTKFVQEREKLKIFNSKLSECSFNRYKFNSTDFCLNGKNCVEKHKFFKSKRIDFISKKINCKCSDRLSYHCGKYCTINNIACDYFFAKNKTLSLSINKSCGNDNMIIFKYFTVRSPIPY